MPTRKSSARKTATSRKPVSKASPSQGLLLKVPGLQKKTSALFKELEGSSKLKKSFIQNPSGVLSPKLLGKKVSKQQVSDANRLLFSILANDKFLNWVDSYATENRGKKVSKEQFSRDFADAVLKFGDQNILGSLIQSASRGGIPGLGGEVFQQLIINNAAGQAIATPVNQPSTSDQTLRSSQNFNGIGFGDLTVINPAVMRAITEQLVDRAKELSRAGTLADLNAEIL
jgi:hypothetical protein